MQKSKAIEILLVEDNPDDVEIARWLLRKSRLVHELQVARDGQEALDLLLGGVRPDLILLDLKLPKMNGHEVLAEISQHASLRRIPIVVLSVSNSVRDISQTLRQGVRDYLLKPHLESNILVHSVLQVLQEERRVAGKNAP
jgi:CheY-like chemotaxis protein